MTEEKKKHTKTPEHLEKIRVSNLRENLSTQSMLNKKLGSQRRSQNQDYLQKLRIANRGENALNHKVTEKDVREIKRLWETGSYSTTAIADKYPISRQSVADIVYGRTWKHIN